MRLFFGVCISINLFYKEKYFYILAVLRNILRAFSKSESCRNLTRVSRKLSSRPSILSPFIFFFFLRNLRCVVRHAFVKATCVAVVSSTDSSTNNEAKILCLLVCFCLIFFVITVFNWTEK